MMQYLAGNTIRQYAHARKPGWTEGTRSDFAETVYWNAGVKTDAATGVATVSFNLSDSITSFRVLADGFAADGVLGAGVSSIESVRPFYIEPKMPLQVTSGDVIRLPVGIINGVSRELGGAAVALESVTAFAGLCPAATAPRLGRRKAPAGLSRSMWPADSPVWRT